MKIIKKYWIFILFGLVIRILIAGFTFHPDIKQQILTSQIIIKDHRLDLYEYDSKIDPSQVLDDLPLSYYMFLPFHYIGRILVIDQVEKKFYTEIDKLHGNSNLLIYLVYSKLPLIFYDLVVGLLLITSISDYLRKRVLVFWLFNPFTLWVSSAIGQFDIIPALFILLTWILVKREKYYLAALSLGLGGAVKFAPFILLPFLLGLPKSLFKKVELIALALTPYIISVIAYIQSVGFRQDVLLAPQISKIFYSRIPLSGGESVFIVLTLMVLLYLLYFSKERSSNDFLRFSLSSLLLTLAFTHFHVQWFLWLTPLLIIWTVNNWRLDVKYAIYFLAASLIFTIFLFDASLQLRLFSPLIPSLKNAQGLVEILQAEQLSFLRSFTSSVFLAASLYMCWNILDKNKKFE